MACTTRASTRLTDSCTYFTGTSDCSELAEADGRKLVAEVSDDTDRVDEGLVIGVGGTCVHTGCLTVYVGEACLDTGWITGTVDEARVETGWIGGVGGDCVHTEWIGEGVDKICPVDLDAFSHSDVISGVGIGKSREYGHGPGAKFGTSSCIE